MGGWVGGDDWDSGCGGGDSGLCFYVLVVVGVDGIDICCGSGDDSSHINYNHIKHCKCMTHCAPLFIFNWPFVPHVWSALH